MSVDAPQVGVSSPEVVRTVPEKAATPLVEPATPLTGAEQALAGVPDDLTLEAGIGNVATVDVSDLIVDDENVGAGSFGGNKDATARGQVTDTDTLPVGQSNNMDHLNSVGAENPPTGAETPAANTGKPPEASTAEAADASGETQTNPQQVEGEVKPPQPNEAAAQAGETQPTAEQERTNKIAAYKEKLAKGEPISQAEQDEYAGFMAAENRQQRIVELRSELEKGSKDPNVREEYNRLLHEPTSEPKPLTEGEKIQHGMQDLVTKIKENGTVTPKDWQQMVGLYNEAVKNNLSTEQVRAEAVKHLAEAVADPNKIANVRELMATREVRKMIQEIVQLSLENRTIPDIKKKRIEQARNTMREVKKMKGDLKGMPDNADKDIAIINYNQKRMELLSLNNQIIMLKYKFQMNNSRIKYLNRIVDVKLGVTSGIGALFATLAYGIESFSQAATAEMDAEINGIVPSEVAAAA